MARPTWFVGLLKTIYPALFGLAKLTRVPLLREVINRLFFEGDRVIYLPKDRVIAVGEAVDTPTSTVLPSQVAEYFVERAAYHWIMDFCICRVSNQCKDYPRELGCLFLGEAVLEINPKIGRRVSKEEALEHLRRCREAGLVHMVGRIKMDSLWLGAGPPGRLFTICNCCPCCCLLRMIPQLDPMISAKLTRMPGVQVRVTDACVGCGLCAQDVCFVGAIHMEGQVATITDICRGCGRCVEVCPVQAIELSFPAEVALSETIAQLAMAVDVGGDGRPAKMA